MSIPTGVSVPGAELVYRVGALAPRPETLVVVNCAGRTRSIIGAQSLVNAGIPNRVAALAQWHDRLDAGRTDARARPVTPAPEVDRGAACARRCWRRETWPVARVSVESTGPQLDEWLQDTRRTTYRFDVRTPDEFAERTPARVSRRRPADSWFRRPTCSPRSAARASCCGTMPARERT